MSSYLSNLLTSTTSRYNNLRRTLLDNEADGDTEDDTHISRVLRAYYTEKGRPYPPWLPPDPKEKRAITPQPQYGSQPGGYFSGRNQYGSSAPMQAGGGGGAGGRAGLGDLWDTPNRNSSPAAAPPQSLRAGRRPIPGAAAAASNNNNNLAPPQARPLPSQRAGSYQTTLSQQQQQTPVGSSPASTGAGGGGGGTAQERLKARLWGGRASPLPSPGVGQTQNPMDQYGAGGGGYRKYG